MYRLDIEPQLAENNKIISLTYVVLYLHFNTILV